MLMKAGDVGLLDAGVSLALLVTPPGVSRLGAGLSSADTLRPHNKLKRSVQPED